MAVMQNGVIPNDLMSDDLMPNDMPNNFMSKGLLRRIDQFLDSSFWEIKLSVDCYCGF